MRFMSLCVLIFLVVQWEIVSPLHRCLPYPVLNCHTITKTKGYKILWFHRYCFKWLLPIVDMFDLQSLCSFMTKRNLDYLLCSLLQSPILRTPTIHTLVGCLVDYHRLVEWLWQLLWVLYRLCLIELLESCNWGWEFVYNQGAVSFCMIVASKT